MFATAIEQAGLFLVLVVVEGHAFAGAWLQPQESATLLGPDAAALRKRVSLEELVLFETMLAMARARPASPVRSPQSPG